jgi:hypothetical protein
MCNKHSYKINLLVGVFIALLTNSCTDRSVDAGRDELLQSWREHTRKHKVIIYYYMSRLEIDIYDADDVHLLSEVKLYDHNGTICTPDSIAGCSNTSLQCITHISWKIDICDPPPRMLVLTYPESVGGAGTDTIPLQPFRDVSESFTWDTSSLDDGLTYTIHWDWSHMRQWQSDFNELTISIDNGAFGGEYYRSRPDYADESEYWGMEGERQFFEQFSPSAETFNFWSTQKLPPRISGEIVINERDSLSTQLVFYNVQYTQRLSYDSVQAIAFTNEFPANGMSVNDSMILTHNRSGDVDKVRLQRRSIHSDTWIDEITSTWTGPQFVWKPLTTLTSPDTILLRIQPSPPQPCDTWGVSPPIILFPDSSRISLIVAFEPNNTPREAARIEYDTEIRACIEKNDSIDIDYYWFEGKAGEIFGVYLDKIDDTFVYLYHEKGYYKCCDTDWTLPPASYFRIRLTEDGKQVVHIEASEYSYGCYRFMIKKIEGP